jgi:hypothetical protein
VKQSIVRIAALALAVGYFAMPNSYAQFAGTGTTAVNVTVGAEAAIQVTTANSNLTSVGTTFANYTGSTNFSYKIRTTKVGGTGAITAQVTTDFSPAGGPSVASPPTAGDTLGYTCTVAGAGTGCAGSITASTGSATSVATFGTDAHSAAAGTAGNSVAWTLVNDPVYQTGSYSATVTFTVSST